MVKTLHKVFFAIFALLENSVSQVGQEVVAQRESVYLETLYAALLLAPPRLRAQLNNKVADMAAMQVPENIYYGNC